MGFPLINPCNFPKAMKLPVKVRVPTKTDNEIVDRLNVVRLSLGFTNSAAATSADAIPPKPLNIATASFLL